MAVLLLRGGLLTSLTDRTSPKRALVAWGTVVGAAISVGFTFATVDGTMRDLDVGHTTSGSWVLVATAVIAIIGAALITRFDEYVLAQER